MLSGKFTVIAPDLSGFGTAYAELAGLEKISIDLAADETVAQALRPFKILIHKPRHTVHFAGRMPPPMVLFSGNHDALMVGICSGSVDLVRRLVGRVRDYHPASHRGPDATFLRKVLQVDLAALGRCRPQDPAAGAACELPCRLRPPLGRAPARALGGADDRRFHADLSWAGLAFEAAGSVGFGTLLYMSASTFLTLGLGDVTSTDAISRLFILLEAGSGYMFLALMITYMPVLEQAYGAREIGSLLIHSRLAARPARSSFCIVTPAPTAPKFCGAICASPSAGWPRSSRPISLIPFWRFTGRTTGADRG